MKPILFLILLLVTSTINFAQTIHRVNANTTITGTNVYNTLQAAHDAAAAGDILIVEPGGSVGSLICSKALTIYGRGYHLDYNPNYSALASPGSESLVGSISIYANNVKLYGLTTVGFFQIFGVSNIIIAKCKIAGTSVGIINDNAVDNVLITQNYFVNNAGFAYSAVSISFQTTFIVSNLTISNNLITAGGGGSGECLSAIGGSYTNNIVINQNIAARPFSGTIYNCVFTNNIFLNSFNATNANSINTTFNNNAFINTSSVTAPGANNIFLSNLSSQFISNTGGSPDNNYRIANGSALKTASSSGGEVGAYGGATPYIQYGISAGPTVLKLNNTGIGNSTTPITATISATSNN